ncbi:MAG: regulatory protein, partial [Mycobacterium sp.]|nr:regulatory protein [Mycobacterium sp.]
RTKGTDDVKVARRLVSMLARRGYNQSMAFDVVKVALASERERRRV